VRPSTRRHIPVTSAAPGPKTGLFVAIAAVLVVLTAAAYAPVRSHDFLQFDDADYVTNNPVVRAGLTARGAWWALTAYYAGNWHPFTWLSHMADVQVFGVDAGWHHLSSVALHLATTLVLFAVFTRVTKAIWPSAFVAAAFALHPLHVESVAWIAERKDVLSIFFFALTLAAYAAYARRPSIARYGAVMLLFAAALLSKPMVVTLPFVLLLMDVWPLGRRASAGWWPLVREKLPLVAMAIATAVATFLAQRQAGAVQSLDAFPLALRVANAPVAYVKYLVSLAWPVDLAALYPYPSSIPIWQSAGAAVLLAAITIGAWRQIRQRPYLVVGWLWFLGTVVPVLGLVQAGSQPRADRFMYMPAIGIFFAVAWAARDWAAGRAERGRIVAAVGVAAIIAMTVLTARLVPDWKDSVSIWERAVAVTEGNYRGHTNLGFALAEAGQRNRAIGEYREALRLNPDYPNAHNYLGVVLAEVGDADGAAAAFRAAIKLRPRFAAARNNLGLTYAGQGKYPEAVTEFSDALAIDPRFVPARRNLGIAYAQQRQFDRALELLTEAVRQDPWSPESHATLAQALADAGRKREALPHFADAIRLGGDPQVVHYSWATVLMDLAEPAEASAHFAAVLRVNPRNPPVVHEFGLSLAEAGRLNEAVAALQTAVQLDPGNADYHHDFGAALARRGLIKEAIAEMEATLKINPQHAEAREALRVLSGK